MFGILFFFSFSPFAAANVDLAVDLFEEEDWAGCRRECLRVQDGDPREETALLLGAVSLLRLNRDTDAAVALLANLVDKATDREVRAMSAYELGRVQWAQGDAEAAAHNLKQAFLLTSDHHLFLRAGCSLDLLIKDFPARRGTSPIIGKMDPAVFQSLETSRMLWTRDVINECRLEGKTSGGIFSKPGQWVVAFYRKQIASAIGARCSLNPTCSEYFRQASVQHGLLAFPLIADRFVREPSVVLLQEHPVYDHDTIRFADPVEDHTEWWRRK